MVLVCVCDSFSDSPRSLFHLGLNCECLACTEHCPMQQFQMSHRWCHTCSKHSNIDLCAIFIFEMNHSSCEPLRNGIIKKLLSPIFYCHRVYMARTHKCEYLRAAFKSTFMCHSAMAYECAHSAYFSNIL